MRKSIGIFLTCICIIGLVGCASKNKASTQLDEKQSVNQKPIDNIKDSQSKKQVDVDLTKENRTISVKTEKDIYKVLNDLVTSKCSSVNLDISNYNNINSGGLDIYKDPKYVIDNNKNLLVSDHPELSIIERIDSFYDKEKQVIRVRIYYFYFERNTDIFMAGNSSEAAVVLNKRVLKKTDKAKLVLMGNDISKYDVQYSCKDNNIINIDKEGVVSSLKAGETDINVKMISKEDNSKVYEGSLKIKVLPEDTIEISNVQELIKVLNKKIGADSINIYFNNMDTDVIYEGLGNIASPYVFFTTSNDYTFITVHYSGESKDKALKAINKINEKSDEIISKIITPNMTEEKKVEAIYDYIINNADYDKEYYSNNKKVDFSSRTAYGILLNNKGICGGFADSINILLRKVGIESYVVSGTAGGDGHAWNVIKLNGEYRYLDVTFDNTYSTKEKISHRYFNITEEQISKDHKWNKERLNKFLKALHG